MRHGKGEMLMPKDLHLVRQIHGDAVYVFQFCRNVEMLK